VQPRIRVDSLRLVFRELNALLGFSRTQTCAYHPAANGVIERFHRDMKAALMYHGTNWTDALPLVLLGIRAAWKEDLNSSSAVLLYGEPLRLPGEFFDGKPASKPTTEFGSQLQRQMSHLRPTPPKRHGTPRVFVFKDLATSPQVYLRQDALRGALQPPYRVLERNEKFFKIELPNGKESTVSIDRLKPAYAMASCTDSSVPGHHAQTSVPVPQATTLRSGRVSRPPVRFAP